LCGFAHVAHDMWALGVLLCRFATRESLFSEDDDDNIKKDSGHWKWNVCHLQTRDRRCAAAVSQK
jgi:hypothetical protein